MLGGIPVANLTAPALLGIAVLMVFLGLLIPRYIYREVVKDRDNWRKVAETEREARVISDAQTAELLELAKTTHSIIVAMFGATERKRYSGGADVVPFSK